MKPVHVHNSIRRKAYIERKNKTQKSSFPFFKIIIPAVLVFLILFLFKATTRIWNGHDKVAVVYKDGENVAVNVLDPVLGESTTLIIPGDTEVEVARNYGIFRIKNVWQLGVNEKINGDLLAETVTNNFLFPVFLWTSQNPGLDKGNLKEITKFIFFPGNTNISVSDRIQIGFFALKVKDLDKSEINLGKSLFLDKGILEDGLPGYKITGPISQRLTVYFSDNEIGDSDVKVNITDATGVSGVSDRLGAILQVIGGKVVSLDKKSVSEKSDCTISGQNSKAVNKIARLFSCSIKNTETSFDVDIKIGEEFAKRF